jgi:hypothetical protein
LSRTFSVNHPLLFILAGVAVVAVAFQSVIFLRKAWKRALELGFSQEKLKKLAVSSAVFSIAPAIAVGIGVITLSGTLGLPLPWLRLSVVGAIMYELTAAETAASALGTSLSSTLTATQFSTIAWTMTVGITTGLILIPLFCEKTTNGISKIGMKDRKWGEHFTNALFFALIATFVGNGLADVTKGGAGLVTALVLLVSALLMVLCGLLRKKLGWKWLNDYAVPICMVLSMAAAIPFTAWLA